MAVPAADAAASPVGSRRRLPLCLRGVADAPIAVRRLLHCLAVHNSSSTAASQFIPTTTTSGAAPALALPSRVPVDSHSSSSFSSSSSASPTRFLPVVQILFLRRELAPIERPWGRRRPDVVVQVVVVFFTVVKPSSPRHLTLWTAGSQAVHYETTRPRRRAPARFFIVNETLCHEVHFFSGSNDVSLPLPPLRNATRGRAPPLFPPHPPLRCSSALSSV